MFDGWVEELYGPSSYRHTSASKVSNKEVIIKPHTPHSLFMDAVKHNNVKLVDEMLKSNLVDVNVKDSDGYNALMVALMNNNVEMVEFLISREINITSVDKDGNNALHVVAANASKTICEKLVNAGADPTQTNRWGETPAFTAMMSKQTASAVYLYPFAPYVLPKGHYASKQAALTAIFTNAGFGDLVIDVTSLRYYDIMYLMQKPLEKIKKASWWRKADHNPIFKNPRIMDNLAFIASQLRTLHQCELEFIRYIDSD